MNYTIVTYPESLNLKSLPGFKDNCRLIDGEDGTFDYGTGSYLVNELWYANPTGEVCENCEADSVSDDELYDLGFLMHWDECDDNEGYENWED